MLRPAVVIAVALAARPVAADPLAKPAAAPARDHLATGNRLYRVRDFAQAIDAYKAGALVEDAPVFHYNLGQCYRQLGRAAEALWHYDRFVERGRPTGELRAAVDAFRAQLAAELAIARRAVPAAAPPPPPSPPPAVVRRPWYRDGLGWTLATSGILAAAGATWLLVDANHLDDAADAETMQAARGELRDRAATRRTLAALAGLGSAALLTTGVIKLSITPDGVAVSGRF